jgi:glycerol-3-phosphate dehydrogenase
MGRQFSQAHRAVEIADATAGELDVLVIGAGATGAGVALDAASRGLRVAVLDMGDLASGTSSKSSKLVHGGLRYLENYDFALVREGVVERQILMRLAPHLVRPMDFVLPVWNDTAKRRLLGVGLTTYDAFAAAALGGRLRDVRRHERISAEEAIARAPALARSGLDYAYVYGDCATDDVRLVLTVLQAARRFGAQVLTYSEVRGVLWADDRVAGVEVLDRLDGSAYSLRARHVVNATGVWADRLLGLVEPGRPATLQPSKGVHIVVPRDRLPLERASVLLPSKQGDARAMFAIPWGPQTILGTTDTLYDGPLDDLGLDEDDLGYVLAAGNAVFDAGLSAEDVVGAWAGVRPLLRAERGESPSDLSRRHALSEGAGGVITITGGKLTTYRRMAKDVVDLIVDRDGRRARCRTARIPLGSGASYDELRADTASMAAALGLGDDTAMALVRSHGDQAAAVLRLIAGDPGLGARISPATPDVLAQVVHAARHEGAATVEDVLARRTRLSVRARDAALPSAESVAVLLAAELGRDADWIAAQTASYESAVRRERGVLWPVTAAR